MELIDLLIVMAAWYPVSYLSIFAHELGHAIAGRSVGFTVTSFGLGFARPFIVLNFGQMKVFLAKYRGMSGVTFCVMPELSPPRSNMLVFLAGGILANLLLATVGAACFFLAEQGRSFSIVVAAVNGLTAAICLIPFNLRVGGATLRSDGGLILQTLLKRETVELPPMTIQSVDALRPLLQSVDDTRTLKAYLRRAAAAWIMIGDAEPAQHVFNGLEALSDSDSPLERGCFEWTRGIIAVAAGRPSEAAAAFDLAEAHFDASGDRYGPVYMALQRIQLCLMQSSRSAIAIETEIERLLAEPLVKRNPAIVVELESMKLRIRMANRETAGLETQLARYETAAARRPTPSRDVLLYARSHDYPSRIRTGKRPTAPFDACWPISRQSPTPGATRPSARDT